MPKSQRSFELGTCGREIGMNLSSAMVELPSSCLVRDWVKGHQCLGLEIYYIERGGWGMRILATIRGQHLVLRTFHTFWEIPTAREKQTHWEGPKSFLTSFSKLQTRMLREILYFKQICCWSITCFSSKTRTVAPGLPPSHRKNKHTWKDLNYLWHIGLNQQVVFLFQNYILVVWCNIFISNRSANEISHGLYLVLGCVNVTPSLPPSRSAGKTQASKE